MAAVAASASSLLLHLSSGLPASPKFHSISFQVRKAPTPLYKYPIYASPSSSNPSSGDREEQRWLREEQRWLREEKRWIREEQRWNSERESLLREIANLKLRIEKQTTSAPLATDAVSNLASILQALKESEANLAATAGRIAESSSAALPLLLEEGEVKEMVVEEIKVQEGIGKLKVEEEAEKKKKPSLRMGSEGESVREMQEALEKLGFYSGEEDVEYSSFSTGTERAVKTWQASVGIREDGIMTADLLERLFMEIEKKDGANGAPVASITEIAEVQKTIVKEGDTTEVEMSQHRVFLLGENRWEEPSRLASSNKPINGSKSSSGTKCLACRGEGRLLCTECDGSGEPNVEPQFLEWVEEGGACPYCEGLGYTICDVCEGKTVVET